MKPINKIKRAQTEPSNTISKPVFPPQNDYKYNQNYLNVSMDWTKPGWQSGLMRLAHAQFSTTETGVRNFVKAIVPLPASKTSN